MRFGHIRYAKIIGPPLPVSWPPKDLPKEVSFEWCWQLVKIEGKSGRTYTVGWFDEEDNYVRKVFMDNAVYDIMEYR